MVELGPSLEHTKEMRTLIPGRNHDPFRPVVELAEATRPSSLGPSLDLVLPVEVDEGPSRGVHIRQKRKAFVIDDPSPALAIQAIMSVLTAIMRENEGDPRVGPCLQGVAQAVIENLLSLVLPPDLLFTARLLARSKSGDVPSP